MSPPRALYTAGQGKTGNLGPMHLQTGINIEIPEKGIDFSNCRHLFSVHLLFAWYSKSPPPVDFNPTPPLLPMAFLDMRFLLQQLKVGEGLASLHYLFVYL